MAIARTTKGAKALGKIVAYFKNCGSQFSVEEICALIYASPVIEEIAEPAKLANYVWKAAYGDASGKPDSVGKGTPKIQSSKPAGALGEGARGRGPIGKLHSVGFPQDNTPIMPKRGGR